MGLSLKENLEYDKDMVKQYTIWCILILIGSIILLFLPFLPEFFDNFEGIGGILFVIILLIGGILGISVSILGILYFNINKEKSESKRKIESKKRSLVLYKTTCTDCGNVFEIPFKHETSRPIYCKNCYQKHQLKNKK